MVTTLGAGALAVGIVEGLAESTALIVKVFSGVLSDYVGKRKGLTVLGYALGAATKPLFAIAPTVGIVLGARLLDRIGKGIRGAPRDAMVADITPPHLRGAAFGLRQSLDTVGAFTGPLLAVALMLLWANDFRRVFWIAVIPAAMAVALLVIGIREPEHPQSGARANPISRANLSRLGGASGGVALALVPLVMVAMNVAYAGAAYPFGALSDRVSHRTLLGGGLVVLLVADLVLASSDHWAVVLAGVVLWGVHLGITQGLLATMVANTAPSDLRGTAYGFFNLASGIFMLVASVGAGWLWDRLGPAYTFYAGAAFCLAALALLVGRQQPRAAMP
jgi:MFS family permease